MASEIKNIPPRRGFRQALDDLSQQDRHADAEARRLAESRAGVRQDYPLSNASGTWINWGVHAQEDGYNIWSAPFPDAYLDHPNNVLYVKNRFGVIMQALENRGTAANAGNTTFDKVFTSGVSGWTDRTTEAASALGTPFTVLTSGSDPIIKEQLYVGLSSTFAEVAFHFQIKGTGITLNAEYWDGSQWTQGVTPILSNDRTSNFTKRGTVELNVPSDWTAVDANGAGSLFWLRFSSSGVPTQDPQAYSIYPSSGVGALLSRSPDQMMNGQHAWTTFSNRIYTTAPNNGPPHRAGMDFIQSGSSDTFRRQFFAGFRRYSVEAAVPQSMSLPAYVEPATPGASSAQLRAAFSGASDVATASGTGDGLISAGGLFLMITTGATALPILGVKSGTAFVGVKLGGASSDAVTFVQGTDF